MNPKGILTCETDYSNFSSGKYKNELVYTNKRIDKDISFYWIEGRVRTKIGGLGYLVGWKGVYKPQQTDIYLIIIRLNWTTIPQLIVGMVYRLRPINLCYTKIVRLILIRNSLVLFSKYTSFEHSLTMK